MNALKKRYEAFLFVFFGLNAKYRGNELVQSTQYFAIAQATFFLGALTAVLVSTAVAFLSEWRIPDNPALGLAWFAGIYCANLLLYRQWIGHSEMQRLVSAATAEDLAAAQRMAVILLGFTVPAIMLLIIFISWYVRR